MYKHFFGLKENPFNVTPDPRYLYLTPHTQEALACMTYCVQARKGFALLTGDVGTGKTTLLNKLLEWLRQEQIASAFVFNPRLNPFQFLDYALSDFGINCQSRLKSTILAELNNWLLERYKAETTAVLIVDEAQDASPELLEEIRLLTNLETPSGKLLQIVLSGQQELEMKLRLPEFRQLRQRISLRSKTHPLSLEETREYLATRLRVAGSDGRQIFAPEAIDSLHHYSEGIPRIINILCEDSLINAYADQKPIVGKEIVEAAARELELDLYPPTAPVPAEPRFEDLIKPGTIPMRSDRGQSMPATTATRKPAVSQTIIRDRAVPAAMPMARIPTPALPVGKSEVQIPPPATSRDWDDLEKPGGVEAVEESVRPGPRPSDTMLTSRGASAGPVRSTPDDEILQALRNKEVPAPPKIRPAAPIVKTPPPTVRPLAAKPATTQKAKRSASQSWVLWVGLLGAVMVGGTGAFLILNHTPQAESPVGGPEQRSGAVAMPQASEEASSSASTATPARPDLGTPASVPPSETARAVPPTPAPEKKPEEPPPPVRFAGREQTPEAAPVATRRAEPTRPTGATEPSPIPKVGGMVVTANVSAAVIMVDGRTSADWVTPFAFSNLAVGPHRVVVSKPGYDDVSAQVVIQEGRTSNFRAQLTTAGGEISIITNPPGLGVSIDGGPFSPSPVQVSVGVGTHTYRIQLPNSRTYEGTFEMRTGAIITRRVDFSAGEWLNPTQ
jgi:general secretion pathway protein A